MARLTRRSAVWIGVVVVLALGSGAIIIAGTTVGRQAPESSVSTQAAPTPTPTPDAETTAEAAADDDYVPVDPAILAALPEARYDAVIPGLLRFDSPDGTSKVTTAYSLVEDSALYGADRGSPVARLPRLNFLAQPTVVVPVAEDGEWTQVLTPSRQTLPSQTDGDAAAQTSAWIRTDALTAPVELTARIVISTGAQTLTIHSTGAAEQVFQVGVGTPDAPTPTGVVGYLQARYLDPAQNQTVYPIELTSLHAAAADEPYAGSDGGLIGLHYQSAARGAVSHGCVRLDEAAITAVNALQPGTPISIVP